MHPAKRFFYVSLGILALAVAFHLGATSAQSQAPGNPVVAACGASNGGGFLEVVAITANGDAYKSSDLGNSWQHRGNCFSGAPIQTQGTTWGRIKAERR
jgi:hypothetical protein